MRGAAVSEIHADVLVLGGGMGGFAAALAAARMGKSVVIVEETDWLGGQLTSQGVPPRRTSLDRAVRLHAQLPPVSRGRARLFQGPLSPQGRDQGRPDVQARRRHGQPRAMPARDLAADPATT